VNDRADNKIADECYDLGKKLSKYKHLQHNIDLSKWPAVENQNDDTIDNDLDMAHYPFATRAIFNFAEKHGENALAKLWKAIGKTPKRKTNMKTVSKAYQKLTGKKLSRLIKEAENDPIP